MRAVPRPHIQTRSASTTVKKSGASNAAVRASASTTAEEACASNAAGRAFASTTAKDTSKQCSAAAAVCGICKHSRIRRSCKDCRQKEDYSLPAGENSSSCHWSCPSTLDFIWGFWRVFLDIRSHASASKLHVSHSVTNKLHTHTHTHTMHS
jgi:hypothetical protein